MSMAAFAITRTERGRSMAMDARRDEADFAVVGGGLVGTAVAWGLARLGRRVLVLDEGDVAHRASRGNFALVWVQSKGMGMPRYATWTRLSSDAWARFSSSASPSARLKPPGRSKRTSTPVSRASSAAKPAQESEESRVHVA